MYVFLGRRPQPTFSFHEFFLFFFSSFHDNFIKNLELNLEYIVNKSPFLIVELGDFDARMQGWYQNNVTFFEGSKISLAITQFSLAK